MTEFLKKIYIKAYELGNKHYLKVAGAAVGVAALIWWCVLYPELCFPRDTYEAVYETQKNDVLDTADSIVDTADGNMESVTEISGVYPDILKADDEQIVISSRLFEWLSRKID